MALWLEAAASVVHKVTRPPQGRTRITITGTRDLRHTSSERICGADPGWLRTVTAVTGLAGAPQGSRPATGGDSPAIASGSPRNRALYGRPVRQARLQRAGPSFLRCRMKAERAAGLLLMAASAALLSACDDGDDRRSGAEPLRDPRGRLIRLHRHGGRRAAGNHDRRAASRWSSKAGTRRSSASRPKCAATRCTSRASRGLVHVRQPPAPHAQDHRAAASSRWSSKAATTCA